MNSSPTPAYGNRPAAAGDAFNYAGTMTETFVRAPVPAGDVTPSPNPESSQTITTAVTQAVTVSKAATFNGVANPFAFHTVETDTANGGLETSTVTSDSYYAGASTDVKFLGSATSTNGATYGTTIGHGNGLVDVLPETSGSITPANTAAETTTEVDQDGATLTRVVAADGTYTETGSNPDGSTVSATANADGSGSYIYPLIEVSPEASFAVSAPTAIPSAAGDEINVTLSIPANLVETAPSPNATPVAIAGSVAVWYPQPILLSNESLTNHGTSTPPGACAIPSSLSKSANEIEDVKGTVDPVFGETDLTTTTTYTEDHLGVVCVKLSDVVTQYYDLSGQTQLLPAGISSTPLQITTTNETLGITSATVLAGNLRKQVAAIGYRAGVEAFAAVLAKHRATRRAAFYRAVEARTFALSHVLQGGHR